MLSFIPSGLTSSSFTLSTENALKQRKPTSANVLTVRRARVPIRCEEGFNYNIYQDDEDRSRRSVAPGERSVTLQKPLGIVLEEGQDGMVFVASLDEDGNALDSGEVKEGDIVVAVSATFGDEVWSTRGVGLDRVLKSIRIRAGDLVTLVLESPEKVSERMTYSEEVAESRRTEAREKFGEREVLNPVSWRSYSAPKQPFNTGNSQELAENELQEEIRDTTDGGAVAQQDWILWVGGGIFVLGVVAVILSIN